MLYREIVAVCSKIHTKHINTLCVQNVDFFKINNGVKFRHLYCFCIHFAHTLCRRYTAHTTFTPLFTLQLLHITNKPTAHTTCTPLYTLQLLHITNKPTSYG